MTDSNLSHAKSQLIDTPLPSPNFFKVGLGKFLLRRFIDFLNDQDVSPIFLQLPSGNILKIGDTNSVQSTEKSMPHMILTTEAAMVRLAFSGATGFAEAYMHGEIDSPDITRVFHWFLQNEDKVYTQTDASYLTILKDRIRHYLRRNNKSGSKKNIAYHYDMGNDFYSLWLDKSMTYSSALFKKIVRDDCEDFFDTDYSQSLSEAQQHKYSLITDWLGINPRNPNDKLLEIGCGWGGFARHCKSVGLGHYYGVTLSQQQLAYATQQMKDAPDFSYHFQDYRDIDGQFDHIASIEMIEAVGEDNWPTYFKALRDRIKKDGSIVIQAITIDHAYFDQYRKTPDFIQKYIFPGGMLASPEILIHQANQHGLTLVNRHNFGPDYAETLRRWHTEFLAKWPDIEQLGYDQYFKRMWQYYLTYCEAGFDAGRIDVGLYHFKPT